MRLTYKKRLEIKEKLKNGYSISQISTITGLNIQLIKKIAKEIWGVKKEEEKIFLRTVIKYKLLSELNQTMKQKYGFYKV